MDPVDFPVDVSTPAFDFTNPAAAFGPLQTIDTPQNVYAPNFVGPLQPGSVQLQTPAVIAQDTSAIAAAAGIAQPGAYDFPMVAAVKLGATAVNAAGQFVNAAGQVVNPTAAQIAAAQAAVQGSVVSGIPNTYLWIGLGALALLGVMSGSRR
jgi:hypothetical protein